MCGLTLPGLPSLSRQICRSAEHWHRILSAANAKEMKLVPELEEPSTATSEMSQGPAAA